MLLITCTFQKGLLKKNCQKWTRAPITELEKGDGSKSYLASCFHQKSETYFIERLQSIFIISVDKKYVY
jgi:hypothetical protein